MSRLPGSWSHLWPCSRPPWPLPWPGDGGVAAAGLADAARGQHHVDAAEDVVHALGLVLDAPGVQQEAGLGLAPHAGGLLDGGHGQAR